MTKTRHFRSQTLAAVSALAVAGLVAGCGSSSGASGSGSTSSAAASASGSSSSSTASAPSGARQSPLSKGLLPASAFGAQANVVSLTLQQLQQQSNSALGDTSGAQVSPPQCADALKGSQPDPSKVKDLVAQSATTAPSGGAPAVLTIEEILQGGAATQAVDQLKSITTTCPKVTVTAPQGASAVVTFSPLDASSVGGQAAAVSFTTAVTSPGQPMVSVPALVGGVQDGDRVGRVRSAV